MSDTECELCAIAHTAASNTEYQLSEALHFLMGMLTPEQWDAYRSRFGETYDVDKVKE